MDILTALKRALLGLFHPRPLAWLLVPMGVSILLWGGLALVYWSAWVQALAGWLAASPAAPYLQGGASWLAGSAVTMLVVLLLLPLAYVTAMLITSTFAMPALVHHAASRDYPQLEARHGGSNMGSVRNAVVGTAVYLVLWLLTLPLWFVSGPLAPLIPLLLNAYLNQRLFRYDALAEHASREEYEALLERICGRLYVLGVVLALLQFVPVLNFFSPIYVGLAFTHLCLAELAKMRREAA